MFTPAARHELQPSPSSAFTGYLVKPLRAASLAARLTAAPEIIAPNLADHVSKNKKDKIMTSLAVASPHDADALDPHRWAALAVLLTGAFLAPLDFFIVNVAMLSITAGLGALAADVQMVISGYAVVFAVFLITGGRLGDIFGRKTIFLATKDSPKTASQMMGMLDQRLAALKTDHVDLFFVHALGVARAKPVTALRYE